MSKILDDYGYFGPDYSFGDNIPLPGQIGVRQEASIGAIVDSVAGVNYYVDTIAFGGPTFFDNHNPQPLGLRNYLNTEMRCSNGATMSEYFDGVTKGDLLGTTIANALQSAGLPGLKGLAPGMLENARDALDPRPIFAAVTGTGYPVCQQVQCPVGDINGRIQNLNQSSAPYIIDPVTYVDGMPYQTRWVLAYDADGTGITVSKDEFAATPKCYNPDGSYRTNPPAGCPVTEPAPAPVGGSGKYGLCTVIRSASLPPTLASGQTAATTENFENEDEAVRIGAAIAVALLGGVALWAMRRR